MVSLTFEVFDGVRNLVFIYINNIFELSDCKDIPLSQSVRLPNPLHHRSNFLLWIQPSIREELSHLIQRQNMFHERCVLTLLYVLGCPTFRE